MNSPSHRRLWISLPVTFLIVLAVTLLVGKAPSRLLRQFVRPRLPMPVLLEMLDGPESFSIVQIGAYVGNTDNDPLYSFLSNRKDTVRRTGEQATKIVFVEPIREYFEQLCKNYSHLQDAEFENVAIAESAGEREMFRLKVNPTEYGYPEWLAQLSSLKKERMEKIWEAYEKNPEYQRFYLENRVVEKVQCMTLQQLLDKHQIHDLDLLQIDAEGYDYQILKTLDYTKTRPRFINYERTLLQEEEPACREMLARHGYQLIDWGTDTFCVRDDCRMEFDSRRRKAPSSASNRRTKVPSRPADESVTVAP